jgi:plasmid stabilization system protein ParE
MGYELRRAAGVARDLELIFDFLFEAAIAFGDDTTSAFDRAATRILAIEGAMEALTEVPYQGTLRPDLLPGLRQVTKGRAIFYFDVDDNTAILRVLAVFYGGQDHQRQMLLRLLSSQSP